MMPRVILENLNLDECERRLCVAALEKAGNLVEAAQLLGVTRRHLSRLIIRPRSVGGAS